ncbi:MAG TPA: acyl-CoA dehydrogenase family protein [Burkholderiales bacterium]|nr:acyl-CoA dehydrogenase family protein [Burkholderiales bacterium]
MLKSFAFPPRPVSHGGCGYSMEFDMQRHYRDARAATIAAGTSQMRRNIIAGLMGLKL